MDDITSQHGTLIWQVHWGRLHMRYEDEVVALRDIGPELCQG